MDPRYITPQDANLIVGIGEENNLIPLPANITHVMRASIKQWLLP